MIFPELPDRALSIRQPWAWAILHAGKDIENRPRVTHYRGRIAVHASAWKSPVDEHDARWWMIDELGVTIPDQDDRERAFQRGGIVGSVEIIDCVLTSKSPWKFENPDGTPSYGYVLRDPQPCEFIPVKGMLGLFDWRKNLEEAHETPLG